MTKLTKNLLKSVTFACQMLRVKSSQKHAALNSTIVQQAKTLFNI